MSNQPNTSNDKQLTIQDIIHEIEQKSKGGGYIYRGERRLHKEHPYNGKVSSNLWREYGIEEGHFSIELVQKEMLAAAKKHTGDLPQDFHLDVIASPNTVSESTQEAIDFEILTEIQHYGGKTNLIDFTTDYFIALFFACDGQHDEDGRVILQKIDEIRGMIEHPRNPRHRVIAQKSVFIRPPKGFIEPDENDIVTIPTYLKQQILEHLRNYHGISTEVIYNDLHGFIKNQDIHGDAYTHFYRGLAYQNRANEASTRKEKQREYEEAIKHYTEAIKLKPDDAGAYNNRGNAYVNKGEVDNAIRDYTEAIKLLAVAEGYHNRGRAYTLKNDWDNAIKDFTKVIKLKPDYPEAYSVRGLSYAKKGEVDNAIKDCNTAIKLNPEFAGAYNNRGMVYETKNDFHNAIKDYSRAIQIKPDLVEAYNNRGSTYARKDEFENAIKDYTKAIQLKPDLAEAYGNRGNAYKAKGEVNSAIRDYNAMIQLKPDDVRAYYNRGNAYAGKGDFKNAIIDYTKTIQFKPERAEAYYYRGIAYYREGDFKNAINDYNKVIQLKPDLAEAYCNRGEAWLHLREWHKAKSDLMAAENMGLDIIASFHNDYASVAEFEKKTGIQLPEDIAALLTSLQA